MTLRVAVIGAGRMGQGIALALSRSGAEVTLLSRSAKPVPTPLSVRVEGWPGAIRGAAAVLLAVPDQAIGDVAVRLAAESSVGPGHVVLHLSGLLDRRALAPLQRTGAALGSFHPLQAVADPSTAPERLRGAYVGIEGEDRAVQVGEELARLVGLVPVRIPADAKPAYHAGATLVANYTVALVGMAVRLAERAGVPPEVAGKLYLPLLHGAADNLDRLSPALALTGAVRRGDAATVAAHLDALEPEERALYAALGREALGLAREAGLGVAAAAEVERVLREGR